MVWHDAVNGLFELVGGFILWMNIRALHRHKQVKGVSIAPAVFFFVWSVWNLYLYPKAGLWLSGLGAISIALAHAVWLSQAVYYSRKQKTCASSPDPSKK